MLKLQLTYAASHSFGGDNGIEFFFAGDLSKFKATPIEIKEGSQYKIVVGFRVQREIVAGLRYFQNTYRKGIRGT